MLLQPGQKISPYGLTMETYGRCYSEQNVFMIEKKPIRIISIIMPMYNVERYVGDAIRSVIAQTWKDFELIVVDDGSTDNSQLVAQLAIGHDPRVRLVSQPNRGLSAARNYGLELVRGNYIYFLDSDDLLTAEALEICMAYIVDLDLDLVTFSGKAFSDMPGALGKFQQYSRPDVLDPINGRDLLLRHYDAGAYSSSVCLYVFSRVLIEAKPIRFDEGYIHEDEGFTPLVYCLSQKSISISKQLFLRRVRENSIMSSGRSYKNTIGWLMAAKKLDDGMKYGVIDLGMGCRHVMRKLQRDLLLSARSTAEKLGMHQQLSRDLKRIFGVGALFSIAPTMAIYAYSSSALFALQSLINHIQFRKRK